MTGQLTSYLFVTALSLLLAAACGGGGPRTDPQEDHPGFANFRETVASAEEDGYTPYWLGRGFPAGGLSFEGPYVAEGDEVTGGGVESSYEAVTPDGKGIVVLDVYSFSPSAWERRQQTRGSVAPGAPSTNVELFGQETKLWAIPAGTRPVNNLFLVLQFGDTTVQVVSSAGGAPVEGGPDVNPLVDEATFLSVVEKLRPYPE
jgi:hypothetical protein